MGKSSIHIQKASAGAITHNSRENYAKSVVFTDEKNEIWNDKKRAFEIFKNELAIRSEAYSKRTNQKLQKTAVTHLSAVVNLERHHTLKDLEKIKDELEKVFDTKVFQMAIHRDEGKIKHKKTGEYLVSGIDFFYDVNDNKYYTSKIKNIYSNELDINEYSIEKNYHAHIEMMGLDSDGNAIRQKMNRFVLSNLQDFTAQTLDMERGNNYQLKKSAKRLDTNEFKKQAKKENEVKKTITKEKNTTRIIKEELELLKKENSKFRTELKEKEGGATREEFGLLEALNKQLQEDLKASKIDLSKALEKIEELKKDIFHPVKKYKDNTPAKNIDVVKYYEKNIDTLKNENKAIQEQKEVLAIENLDLQKKINSSSSQNDLLIQEIQDLKAEVKILENENKTLKEKIKNIVSLANEKIKYLFQFKIWNNYKFKQTRYEREYINENKEDYWEELVYDNPKIHTLYKDNIENELIKNDGDIPGEKIDYSKLNLSDILNPKKEDLENAKKDLEEILKAEENKETVVHTRKLF